MNFIDLGKYILMQSNEDRVCVFTKNNIRIWELFNCNYELSTLQDKHLPIISFRASSIMHLCQKSSVFLWGNWLTLTSFSSLSVQSSVVRLTTQSFAVGWVSYLIKIKSFHKKQLVCTNTTEQNWFLNFNLWGSDFILSHKIEKVPFAIHVSVLFFIGSGISGR